MITAYKIDPGDNVATLLAACRAGEEVRLRGVSDEVLAATEDIRAEHKIALIDIVEGESVLKYGTAIGRATRSVKKGETIHLHNCASIYDERSNTLDVESGAPTDTPYV